MLTNSHSDGQKDLSNLHQKVGRERLRGVIDNCIQPWAEGAGTADSDAPPIEVRPLSRLTSPQPGDRSELLKSRFLCRGAGLLVTGPTGIGKSSFVVQNSVTWGLGCASFGIEPKGCIKTLLVQAENDDGDLAEMRDGIFEGLGLSQQERAIAGANLMVARVDSIAGRQFCDWLNEALKEHGPDLVIIDPALAYLGGDASSQRDVGAFLRQGLNPLLAEHDCGAIVIHHTVKPSGERQKPNWRAGDFAYSGAGSAEWANWARAVISIRSIGRYDRFELRLAKRGQRLGWKHSDGATPRYVKQLAHEQGKIFWREVTEEEEIAANNSSNRPNRLHIIPLVPQDGSISKIALVSKVQDIGIGENRAKGFIADLVAEGRLHLWRIPRLGTRPTIHIALRPQVEADLSR
jgi:hypothetical protein